MAWKINCDCGVTIRGKDDDEIATNAISHAKDDHSITITREQALAMAEPA